MVKENVISMIVNHEVRNTYLTSIHVHFTAAFNIVSWFEENHVDESDKNRRSTGREQCWICKSKKSMKIFVKEKILGKNNYDNSPLLSIPVAVASYVTHLMNMRMTIYINRKHKKIICGIKSK